MKARLISLMLSVLLLSGCTALHTEEQLMVVVMGIDQTKEQQLSVTVKVPSFSASSDGSGGSDSYITLSAVAEDFPAALSRLSSIAPRALNFSQTRQLLIQNDALLNHPDLITLISLVDGMRSQVMVSICTEEAKQLMEKQKVSVGTRLSRYIDTTLNTALNEGIIPDSTLIRTLSQISSSHQDALLSIFTNADTGNQNQASIPVMQQTSENQAQNKKENGTEVHWTGAAAMDGQTLSGYLNGFETMLCRFICGEISSMTYVTKHGIYQLTSRFGPHFSVDQNAESDVLCIQGNINILPKYGTKADLSAIRDQLEQDTSKLIRTLQSLRCDALGFGGHYSKQFLTLSAWEQSEWKESYISADTDVHFNLTLMDE